MTADRLPKFLRRRAHGLTQATPPRRCYCGRPVTARSACGCCCVEHETDVAVTVDSLIAAMDRHPSGKATTDGGPSVLEYLKSKGEA